MRVVSKLNLTLYSRNTYENIHSFKFLNNVCSTNQYLLFTITRFEIAIFLFYSKYYLIYQSYSDSSSSFGNSFTGITLKQSKICIFIIFEGM